MYVHINRAEEWNVNNFLWSGRLVLVAKDEVATIRLEDPATGDIFAVCPVVPGAIEPVSDSSRYFVLRLDDGRGWFFLQQNLKILRPNLKGDPKHRKACIHWNGFHRKKHRI